MNPQLIDIVSTIMSDPTSKSIDKFNTLIDITKEKGLYDELGELFIGALITLFMRYVGEEDANTH
jgi:hypothetical protein